MSFLPNIKTNEAKLYRITKIYAFLKHTHKTSHTDKNKTESLVCRYMKNGKSHVKKFQTANFIINK